MAAGASVDHDRCVGSTMCVLTAPGAFELNDDGQSEAVDPGAVEPDTLVDAASQCPVEAITVTVDGEQRFP